MEQDLAAASLQPDQLAGLLGPERAVDLIDVRTPVEFREVHLEGARNVPLERLDPDAVARERTAPDQPLYVICQTGSRGRQAQARLARAGLGPVVNIEGGTRACLAAGLPMVHGRKVVSLERQVRIAAGSLVLLGLALGWLFHPGFLGLSAFVGAGLVFAGITDFCGMGLLLARMPWNRGPRPAGAPKGLES
jgi:rhodanese-related sulfurtransferase